MNDFDPFCEKLIDFQVKFQKNLKKILSIATLWRNKERNLEITENVSKIIPTSEENLEKTRSISIVPSGPPGSPAR